jgi:hypothetical protein
MNKNVEHTKLIAMRGENEKKVHTIMLMMIVESEENKNKIFNA